MTETPKARELNKVIRYTLFSVFKVETPPGDANRDELTYQSIVPRRSRAAVGVWADERHGGDHLVEPARADELEVVPVAQLRKVMKCKHWVKVA